MNGLRLAALYGFRPHMLGFCGPAEARQQKLLKKFLQGKLSSRKARKVLEKFKGAFPYYQLIAKSNKIKNPFDERVVKAYWIGNKLLDKVKTKDLHKMVIKDFSGPGLLSKQAIIKKAETIAKNSKPHHSFHVLMIGSVTGSVDFKNTKLKDLCRVGWGKIKKIKNKKLKIKNKIEVEYQPLVGKKKIRLGKPIKKEIIWDRGIVREVSRGDWVAFHWDWLVMVLKKQDVTNLKKYTLETLLSLRGGA